jgi:microsomal dipeptidase-like Zn-dependent dipeptidase
MHDPTLSSTERSVPPPGRIGRLLGSAVAWWLHRPTRHVPVAVDAAALRLHRRLPVADLHADCLLWGRDLLVRSHVGHVDLPRLLEGGVALQVFSVVTHAPKGQNIERNESAGDNITLLATLQRWPAPARRGLLARALYQAQRLAELEARADGRLKIVRTRRDMDEVLTRRAGGEAVVGALLSLEGAHALEGRLENLEPLFDAGFRMVAPSHFFDTDVGGSAHGVRKGGLTALGRQWVARMEQMQMAIDLAHASEATLDDVLALATRALIVSHTGVKGTCDNPRNLADDHVRRIAAGGGLIGIGFWDTATGGTGIEAIVRAIRHAVAVAGIEHVAYGSDFDGAVRTPIDAAQLPQLTAALLRAGFADAEVGRIAGENVVRVLGTLLPP